jgi:transcriptional regulator with XRE-family HTH domain
MDARNFGIRLTMLRESHKLSITQLANRMGIDYMQVSRYEKGLSLPSLDTASRIAHVLQLSLDELVTGTKAAEPPAPEPLAFNNTRLFERMRDLDRLPPDRQKLAMRLLDTVIAGYELENLSTRVRST